MVTATAKLCARCEQPLTSEEVEYPDESDGDHGGPICCSCECEVYHFECCACGECGHVDDQHNMLVVFEEQDSMGGPSRKVKRGVYKILGGPYHGGPLIGRGWLYGDMLERVGSVPRKWDGDGYPCGHLCKECQGKFQKR